MNRKETKESVSVSLKSTTIEVLDAAVEMFDFDSRSVFVERAIKSFVVQNLGSNPLIWNRIYKEVTGLS